MARYFKNVIATDASGRQIESASTHSRVEYRVASAEDAGLAAGTTDLITVGQALHWFDFDRFFAEARRVASENGVLAVWCYGLCEIRSDIDAIVDELYADLVDEFWPAERVYVEQGYSNIEMPGVAIEAPEFHMQLDWRVDDMLGYLRTWSACQRYLATRGEDPVTVIESALRAAWGNGARNVRWPLRVRVCRLQ